MIKRIWDKDSLKIWILLLIHIRKKLEKGEVLSSEDEKILSSALGIQKFRDEKDKKKKLDMFFNWARKVFEKKG